MRATSRRWHADREEYIGRYAAAALDLIVKRYLLPEDLADLLTHAREHYDWAVGEASPRAGR
jgi:hypothetical protein